MTDIPPNTHMQALQVCSKSTHRHDSVAVCWYMTLEHSWPQRHIVASKPGQALAWRETFHKPSSTSKKGKAGCSTQNTPTPVPIRSQHQTTPCSCWLTEFECTHTHTPNRGAHGPFPFVVELQPAQCMHLATSHILLCQKRHTGMTQASAPRCLWNSSPQQART